MKRIQVLLSAYNGENYIAEQIKSILRQKYVQVSLLIRDDGSEDATWKILSEYAAKHRNVCVYAGKNIGTQKSYFDLLAHADSDMDYFAFSDQDDVWHTHKLRRAVEILSQETENKPLLYASNVICASEDLRIKTRIYRLKRKHPSFGNALVENICTGCTEVFNKQLLELVRMHPPGCAILHDWWFYMTAACFGKVCFDEKAYILYRQHAHNQVGMQATQWNRWKRRMLRIGSLRGLLSQQAKDFADAYEDMHVQNRGLELMAGYRQNSRKKWEVVVSGLVYRQNRIDRWIYKILFLAGYL